MIVIGLENASRDTLEQMFQVSRTVRRPIAMFVDNDDTAIIQAAVDAGVSVYVVNCLSKDRVRPIIDITISRFHVFRRLQEELAQAREALEARKVIERAKGVLMQQQNLSEEEAYKLMRRTAMSQKRKLFDIAQSVGDGGTSFSSVGEKVRSFLAPCLRISNGLLRSARCRR